MQSNRINMSGLSEMLPVHALFNININNLI